MRLADITIRTDGDATVATVTGEVDMSNAPEVQSALADGTPNDASGLIIDLTELDYLDSSGIQLLFKLQAALRARSQGLVLVVPDSSVVKDTFRLAGVTTRIPLVEDLEQALESVEA